ncbi:hypothetical protein JX265_012667 [Neoarthrinium moseri]|uniref:MYND-type domain-containing protein n=1 Tax=Neoarthrinium moseri TaxID=1658444 RepID=A0A9P9W9X9_9PEZI|nr:hypothetical protein JX266_011275 [Neoarthrinium moseri]KAI1853836.1 hypothetical protein JX265_012667 [Neoarthrinium moseri]
MAHCIICMWPDATACGQCKSAHYCSRKCQKTDWESHKLVCTPFAQMGPRPSSDHYKALLFLTESTAPKPVWVQFSNTDDFPSVDGSYDWLGPKGRGYSTENTHVNINRRTNKDIVPKLRFFSGSVFQYDQSTVNQSFATAVRPFTANPSLQFKGPVLAYTMIEYTYEQMLQMEEAGEEEPREYEYLDISLSCFRDLVDFSIHHEARETDCIPPKDDGIIVTKFHSVHDCLKSQRPQHGQVAVKAPFAGGDQSGISTISQILGTPLRLNALDTKAKSAGYNDGCPYASFLMMDLDITSPSWGTIAEAWRFPGSVLVGQVNGSNIQDHIAATMARFCMEEVYPRVKKALQDGTMEAKEKAMKPVCLEMLYNYRRDDYPYNLAVPRRANVINPMDMMAAYQSYISSRRFN